MPGFVRSSSRFADDRAARLQLLVFLSYFDSFTKANILMVRVRVRVRYDVVG